MTRAITAYKAIDGRLFESEKAAHSHDQECIRLRHTDRVMGLLGVDKYSSADARTAVYRLMQNWDSVKKVLDGGTDA